jgi:hypothetical protein
MNALLAPVRGQPITARQMVREGVFVTTYANGKQIVVNYSDQPVNYRGVVIPARDAALVENMP